MRDYPEEAPMLSDDEILASKMSKGYGQVYGTPKNFSSIIQNTLASSGPTNFEEGSKYILEGLRSGGAMSQIGPVYHGSPYRFQKFLSEKIGTGEGAQAFGYGHYLSELPGVARSYTGVGVQNKLDIWKKFESEQPMLAQDIKGLFKTSSGKSYGNNGNFGSKLRTILTGSTNVPIEKELGDKIRKSGFDYPTGNIYEATLHKGKQPGEYEYMRWDEKLSPSNLEKIEKQYSKEQGIPLETTKRYITHDEQRGYTETGETLLIKLRGYFKSDKEASAFLKRAGIDGIKYPTGTLSGVKGSDKFNYVVFDPTDIAIEAVR
jgi:hypothetical protein